MTGTREFDDCTILLVDDDALVLTTLCERLQQPGRAVYTAASLAEAAHITARNIVPDIVFVDRCLPDGSGLDFIGHLHDNGVDCETIVMTGFGSQDAAIAAMRAGACDFLLKPLDLAAVEVAVAAALNLIARRRSNRRCAAIAHANGAWDWDLATNSVYYSRGWRQLLDAPEGLTRNPDEWFGRVHPRDLSGLQRAIADVLHTDEENDFAAEYRMRASDGGFRWMLAHGTVVRDERGRATRLVGTHVDITGRKRNEADLEHMAMHDPLTGLANRGLFEERLTRAFARVRRGLGRALSVMFVDLDGLKRINDTVGHVETDQLLIEVAERLRSCVRGTDTLARLGGDEFAALLEDVEGTPEAIKLAERILACVGQPIYLRGVRVDPSASIGIALSTHTHASARDLLRDADRAMYRAKSDGGGRYQVHHT